MIDCTPHVIARHISHRSVRRRVRRYVAAAVVALGCSGGAVATKLAVGGWLPSPMVPPSQPYDRQWGEQAALAPRLDGGGGPLPASVVRVPEPGGASLVAVGVVFVVLMRAVRT